MRSLRFGLAAIVVAAGLGVGCGWRDSNDSRTATAGLPSDRLLLAEHDWVLNRAASTLTVDDDNEVTLSIVDDVISGFGPCNTFRGEISIGDGVGDGKPMEIGALAQTKRACPEPTMASEDEFFATLQAVDTIDVDEEHNKQVVLRDGDARLVFRRASK